METELAALAASGAAALITLMVSDAWDQTKDRLARLLGHDDSDRTHRDLAVSRAVLLTAIAGHDDDRAAEVEREWRDRLLRLLQTDPALAENLRRLPTPPAVPVHNEISGTVRAGLVVQAGRMSETTLHLPQPPKRPDGREDESHGSGSATDRAG